MGFRGEKQKTLESLEAPDVTEAIQALANLSQTLLEEGAKVSLIQESAATDNAKILTQLKDQDRKNQEIGATLTKVMDQQLTAQALGEEIRESQKSLKLLGEDQHKQMESFMSFQATGYVGMTSDLVQQGNPLFDSTVGSCPCGANCRCYELKQATLAGAKGEVNAKDNQAETPLDQKPKNDGLPDSTSNFKFPKPSLKIGNLVAASAGALAGSFATVICKYPHDVGSEYVKQKVWVPVQRYLGLTTPLPDGQSSEPYPTTYIRKPSPDGRETMLVPITQQELDELNLSPTLSRSNSAPGNLDFGKLDLSKLISQGQKPGSSSEAGDGGDSGPC